MRPSGWRYPTRVACATRWRLALSRRARLTSTPATGRAPSRAGGYSPRQDEAYCVACGTLHIGLPGFTADPQRCSSSSCDAPLPPGDKLAEWVQWYAERRWHRIFGQPPLLLFVYGDYGRAPGSLVRAVEACSPSLPICVGHERTLDEHGLDGEVWRRAGGGPAVSALALARAAVEAASSPPSVDR